MTVPACSFVQVEVQCEDPNLMQCGLEKCVAVDGSVEWVSAHSKVRLVSLRFPIPFRSLNPFPIVHPFPRTDSCVRAPKASSGTSTAWG